MTARPDFVDHAHKMSMTERLTSLGYPAEPSTAITHVWNPDPLSVDVDDLDSLEDAIVNDVRVQDPVWLLPPIPTRWILIAIAFATTTYILAHIIAAASCGTGG